MLNILEGYDLRASGPGSAATLHRVAEAMRRGFADRARYLGDPDFNPAMPVARLIAKDYAASLRKTIREDRASKSSPSSFEWPAESERDHAPLGGGRGQERASPSPTPSRTATAPRSSCRGAASC